jgi:UDP-2,3-diacylglucosamine hydrolase
MTTSLFISDLHLDPGRPEGIQLFDDFIRQKAVIAEQLFILGDLFEYWLGDDASKRSGYQPIAESLARSISCMETGIFWWGRILHPVSAAGYCLIHPNSGWEKLTPC